NQWMPMGLLAKNWEILTYRMPIDPAGSKLVHPIICYTGRSAPVHSAAMHQGVLPRRQDRSRRTVAAALTDASRVACRAAATERTCRGLLCQTPAKFGRCLAQAPLHRRSFIDRSQP